MHLSRRMILPFVAIAVMAWGAHKSLAFPGTGQAYIPSGGGISLTVAHAYPTNGATWMSYVKGGAGSKIYNQTDTACAGTETGGWGNYTSGCIHGGEILTVTAPGYSACTNLTMTDSLGVFNWVCDSTTNPVKFYSTGMLPGKGLSDLINATSWKNNSVTLKSSGSTVGSSTAGAWWTNSVTALTDNSASGYLNLSASGTIYTLAASRATSGYRITANSIAIVVLPGAILSFNGTATSNCSGGTPVTTCVATAYTANFIWFEGALNAYNATATAANVIILETSKYSRFNNVSMVNAGSVDLQTYQANYGLFTNLLTENGWNYGIYVDVTTGAVFENVRTANHSSYGVYFNGSSNNTFINLTTVGGSNGVYMTGSANNTLVNVTSASNGTAGLQLVSTSSNSNNFVNLNVVNNVTGIQFPTSSAPTTNNFNNVMASTNTTGIALGKATTTFTGWVVVGNNTTTCSNSLTATGLADTTCADQTGSTATLVTGVNDSTSFYGALSANDVANTSDTNGSATFSNTLDFFNYDNSFRMFSNGAQSTLNITGLGQNSSGTSRIWDWSIKSGDTILLNRSGNGSTANGAFTNGSACPSQIGGSQTFTDSNSKTYLVNAVEVLGTGGNDDGLCESNETCIYTPNIGSYQGTGNYLSDTCTFSNGTVTGITMYAYPTNGE